MAKVNKKSNTEVENKVSQSKEVAVYSEEDLEFARQLEENFKRSITSKARFPSLDIVNAAQALDGSFFEGADGKPIGAGHYNIGETELRAKEITFRPLLIASQYIKYDEEASKKGEWKVVASSVFTESPFDNALDTLGTFRCGMPMYDKNNPLSTDEWKRITNTLKCYTHAFGIAYFDGGPEEGTLVDLKVSGVGKGKVIDNLKLQFRKQKLDYTLYKVKLGLKANSNGKNTFYDIVAEPDFTTQHSYLEVIPQIREIQKVIKDTEDYVLSKRKELLESYRGKVSTDANDKHIVDAIDNSDEDDFNDAEFDSRDDN